MAELHNLMRMVYDARLAPLDCSAPVDPAIRQVVDRMNRLTLSRLSKADKDDVETVLEGAFGSLPRVQFYPNGRRNPPDMVFSRSCARRPLVDPETALAWSEVCPPMEWREPIITVEWKSTTTLNSSFQFNDSVPQGHIWYLFMSRRERRYLLMRGDTLLVCMSQKRVEGLYNAIMKLREREKVAYGRRHKIGCDADGIPPASALFKATPRWNPQFTNFLRYAKGNGVFDMDSMTIWSPQ
jgi:hypothetical protein